MAFSVQDFAVGLVLAASFGILLGIWATRAYFLGQFREEGPRSLVLGIIQRYAETANELDGKVKKLNELSVGVVGVAHELGELKADLERAILPLERIRRELKWSADAKAMLPAELTTSPLPPTQL